MALKGERPAGGDATVYAHRNRSQNQAQIASNFAGKIWKAKQKDGSFTLIGEQEKQKTEVCLQERLKNGPLPLLR